MELVLPVRKGGLGNQLFQVTAGLLVAKEQNKTLILPKEMPHVHNKQKQLYEDTIFRSFPNRLNFAADAYAIVQLEALGFLTYPGEPGFEPWNPSLSTEKLILHGYFQYYPTIQPHESYIRETYRNNLDLSGGEMNTVGIHVRRGDFHQFSDVHFLQDSLYYRRAIYELESRRKKPCHYKVFSDDLDWCKQQDVFEMLGSVEFVEEPDEIECFRKMIQCEGGFICANSTYSWWAAFLGAYRNRAPIVVPANWMKGYNGSLFPPEWIQLHPPTGTLHTDPPDFLNLHTLKQAENVVKPQSKKIRIHIDTKEIPTQDEITIYLQLEPTAISNTEQFLLENGSKFTAICTYNQKILDRFPHASKTVFPACSWIPGYVFRSIDVKKKQPTVSVLTGFKRLTEGHAFRHFLYFNQTQFSCLPVLFFRSSVQPHLPQLSNNPLVEEKKDVLFETFQFSIVIENSSQPNYFTEKLIDCLITKTIPIYYGAPNISDYFDTTGWILLEAKEIQERAIELFTKLSLVFQEKEYYNKYQATIEANYQTCLNMYTSFYKNINHALLSIPAYRE